MLKNKFKPGDKISINKDFPDIFDELRGFGYTTSQANQILRTTEFTVIKENAMYKNDDFVWYQSYSNQYPLRAAWVKLITPRTQGHFLTKMFKN